MSRVAIRRHIRDRADYVIAVLDKLDYWEFAA